jgi:GTP-binding protein
VKFIDEVAIEVCGGDGGNGSAAMRREKFRPLGGPAGGDGGAGGGVVLVADRRLTTLLDLSHRRLLRAKRGQRGRGNDQHGKAGACLTVRVPLGTQVFDADSGELIADLSADGQQLLAARGGQGGRGNLHFVSPTNRAPRTAEEGRPGERRRLRLVLKLLADVGIVGFPNAGKSTLVRAVSRARPRVADYPFTTLVPSLGLVRRTEYRSFVIADIPGIIEGASGGAGLGLRFLRHVERTRVLLFLVTLDPGPGRSFGADLKTLKGELRKYDEGLAGRRYLIAVSKLDLSEVRGAFSAFHRAMKKKGLRTFGISAVTGEGVAELLDALEGLLEEKREEE